MTKPAFNSEPVHLNQLKYFIFMILRTLFTTLFVFLFSVTIAFTSTTSVEEETPYDVAVRLQENYQTVKSLSFHFSQRTQSELGGRPQAGRGEAYFLKTDAGGKMRWNYSLPEQQTLVSDGKTFSMYFAHLKQMIVSPASAMESDLTYAFFTGAGSIPEDFLIFTPDDNVGSDNPDRNYKVIKIVPKEVQSQVKDIHLWVTDQSLIQRIEIRDHFGTVTILNLSNIEIDALANVSENELQKLFNFTPPEDTEIIEQ